MPSAGAHVKPCHSLAKSKQRLQKPTPIQSDSIPGVRVRQPHMLVNGGPNSGLGANGPSDCRPRPHRKISQGTTQGKCPAVWNYFISGKCLVRLKSKAAQRWSTNTTGTKCCLPEVTRPTAQGWLEGKSGPDPTAGCMQHTQEMPLKSQVPVSRGHCTAGHYQTSSS